MHFCKNDCMFVVFTTFFFFLAKVSRMWKPFHFYLYPSAQLFSLLSVFFFLFFCIHKYSCINIFLYQFLYTEINWCLSEYEARDEVVLETWQKQRGTMLAAGFAKTFMCISERKRRSGCSTQAEKVCVCVWLRSWDFTAFGLYIQDDSQMWVIVNLNRMWSHLWGHVGCREAGRSERETVKRI